MAMAMTPMNVQSTNSQGVQDDYMNTTGTHRQDDGHGEVNTTTGNQPPRTIRTGSIIQKLTLTLLTLSMMILGAILALNIAVMRGDVRTEDSDLVDAIVNMTISHEDEAKRLTAAIEQVQDAIRNMASAGEVQTNNLDDKIMKLAEEVDNHSGTLNFINRNLDIDACVAAPCRNGATCVDGHHSYSCTCLQGFSGDTCEHARDGILPRSLITGCTSSPALDANMTCERAYDSNVSAFSGSAFVVARGSDFASSGWIQVNFFANFTITGVAVINRCQNKYDQAKYLVLKVSSTEKRFQFPCLGTCSNVNYTNMTLDAPVVSGYVRLSLSNKCFPQGNSKVGISEMQIFV